MPTDNIVRETGKKPEELGKAEQQIKSLQIPYEYDTKEWPIEVLLFKFKSDDPENSTIIIPTYQREFIWRDDMKARFIESLLLGVPIQPLFAAILDEDGALELIDGSQRLRTIEEFVKGDLKLTGLKKLKALNGFTYADFTQARKNKFGLINVRIHVISDKADLSIRQDIFDRINTSGDKVRPSELRKGALAGSFYDFVMEMAKDELFKKLCPITPHAAKRGEAEELILRFFTYAEYGTKNKEKGQRLMDQYLIEKNKMGFDPAGKKKDFERMLKFVERYFPLGFRKVPNATSTPRVRFEAIAVGSHFALKENSHLVPVYMDWLESKEFDQVTTSDSSGNPGRIKQRIEFVKDCLLNKKKKEDLTYEAS